jgi:tRNA pseudouridine55 synthase
MDQPKTYEATVKLGATTETDDPESPEVPSPRPGRGLCAREEVERALQNFVGEIQQRPPAYSAIKIDGRRACDRVRDGQQIELRPRRVRVYSIDLLDYTWPLAKLRVDCGRGTYIRSIARDLGEVLQTGGYLTELRRTRIGLFSIEQAVTIDKLTRDDFASVLRPIPQLI